MGTAWFVRSRVVRALRRDRAVAAVPRGLGPLFMRQASVLWSLALLMPGGSIALALLSLSRASASMSTVTYTL